MAKPLPYSTACPKCQAAAALRTYCAGCAEKRGEHLHCGCGECGYSWLTTCADADGKDQKRKGGQ